MPKILDVRTVSITEAKKDFSKIIKETNETEEPTYIFNHNRPQAVLMNHEIYERLVKENAELKEQIFMNQLYHRMESGPNHLVPAEKVINTDLTDNPFVNLSDEELFD